MKQTILKFDLLQESKLNHFTISQNSKMNTMNTMNMV